MSALSLSVRPASIEDAPMILSIFLESEAQADVKGGINLISVMEWIENATEQHPLWVQESAGQIVGWCSLERFYGLPALDGAVEIALYIAAAYQRQGCGHWLLNHIAQQAAQMGIHTLVAYILGSNQKSNHFFMKNGFQEWGCLPNVVRSAGLKGDLKLLGRQLS
ncbi:Putative phosphinothricin acetyltransferase YwnH [Marinomonas aquimarina]|uniref:Putative phosphinothricin acetyltransferase YwnH n=1 Tax=Marinomonas aquimarina TaxID=295068 RepID=A0A1A8T3N2_9GAMM|nr:GNAT family N-acetyltransferase [Marinomonas aquimarina]SBS26457.1 Putative phosphinothricin acetyltransferase YwnH [Marinomonas aquimarina]